MIPEKCIKVLIADDKKESIDAIKKCLAQIEKIEICAIANNGEEALNKIYELQPDIVLLDVVMPIFDGISVLRRLNKKPAKKKVKTIMLTAANDNYVLNKAFDLGASYYLIKPINPEVLCETVLMVYNMDKNEDDKSKKWCSTKDLSLILGFLSKLEVPTHLLGYYYIMDAVSLLVNESYARMPYNQICERIANQNDTTRECVETAIKGAIKKTAIKNSKEYNRIFSSLSTEKPLIPSSLKFITKINEEIQMLKSKEN